MKKARKHEKEQRPWGYFKCFAKNEPCTVKILHLNANSSLSKQYHKHREEIWIPLSEGLKVELGDKKISPRRFDTIFIPRYTCTGFSQRKAEK